MISDCLNECKIGVPTKPFTCKKCVVTTVTPGFEHYLDIMLTSLADNGNVADAEVVVMGVNADQSCLDIIAKHGAHYLPCTIEGKWDIRVKAVMYSVGQVIDAEQFVCLDADVWIMQSISDMFDKITELPDAIFTTADCSQSKTIKDSFRFIYQCDVKDFENIGISEETLQNPLVINSGVLAGSKKAFNELLDRMIAMPDKMKEWAVTYCAGDQLMLNIAVVGFDQCIVLPPIYNYMAWVDGTRRFYRDNNNQPQALHNGENVKIMHMAHIGKARYDWLTPYFKFSDVLKNPQSREPIPNYLEFVTALKMSMSSHGHKTTFYRSLYHNEDVEVVEKDKDFTRYMIPYALLRAIGAKTVLEINSNYGMSTACIAMALPLEDGTAVVTLDSVHTQACGVRENVWGYLPKEYRDKIADIQCDPGHRMYEFFRSKSYLFDAVVINTPTTSEELWTRFRFATRIARPGASIMIQGIGDHENTFALSRIRDDGYNCNVYNYGAKGNYMAVIINTQQPMQEIYLPHVTIAANINSTNDYAISTFRNSLLSLDYPASQIRLMLSIQDNYGLGFEEWAMNQGYSSVNVVHTQQQDAAKSMQGLLDLYCTDPEDYGMMIWEPAVDWSAGVMKSFIRRRWPLINCVTGTISEPHHSVRLWNDETKQIESHPACTVPFQGFTNYVCCGGVFALNSIWKEFQKTNGWNDFSRREYQDIDAYGWISIRIAKSVYVNCDIAGWNYSNEKEAIKLLIEGDSAKLLRKSK